MRTSYTDGGQKIILRLDHPQEIRPEDLRHWGIHVLVLGCGRSDVEADSNLAKTESCRGYIFGLALKELQDGQNAGIWQRIGWMQMLEEEGRYTVDASDNWKTVSLV